MVGLAGLGDITPYNDVERFACTVLIIIGVLG
jgi:hypothetical protein